MDDCSDVPVPWSVPPPVLELVVYDCPPPAVIDPMGSGPNMPTVALTSHELVVDCEFCQSVLVLELVLVPLAEPPATCVTCCVGADCERSKAGVIWPPLVPTQVLHCRLTEWYAMASPKAVSGPPDCGASPA